MPEVFPRHLRHVCARICLRSFQAELLPSPSRGPGSFALHVATSAVLPSGGDKNLAYCHFINMPRDAASSDARLSAGAPPQPWTTARGACRRPAAPWEPSTPSSTTLRPTWRASCSAAQCRSSPSGGGEQLISLEGCGWGHSGLWNLTEGSWSSSVLVRLLTEEINVIGCVENMLLNFGIFMRKDW